eukprot:GHVL01023983.1.p1 GENE.GHVL01023983.1~~GHVL01023983.1.p1  ORF type:complete len:842 (-),score=198.18 GHVL01023983.1:464-2989(-)
MNSIFVSKSFLPSRDKSTVVRVVERYITLDANRNAEYDDGHYPSKIGISARQRLKRCEVTPDVWKFVQARNLGAPRTELAKRTIWFERTFKKFKPVFLDQVGPRLARWKTAIDEKGMPPPILPEIAFAGRSNCGKSTVVNNLCGDSKKAFVASKPGTTQEISFYRVGIPAAACLVDLPGYGFAMAKEERRMQWTEATLWYIKTRKNLQKVMVLIDCRAGLKNADREFLSFLCRNNVKWQVILTKCDHLPARMLSKRIVLVREELNTLGGQAGQCLAVSSKHEKGMDDVRRVISSLRLKREIIIDNIQSNITSLLQIRRLRRAERRKRRLQRKDAMKSMSVEKSDISEEEMKDNEIKLSETLSRWGVKAAPASETGAAATARRQKFTQAAEMYVPTFNPTQDNKEHVRVTSYLDNLMKEYEMRLAKSHEEMLKNEEKKLSEQTAEPVSAESIDSVKEAKIEGAPLESHLKPEMSDSSTETSIENHPIEVEQYIKLGRKIVSKPRDDRKSREKPSVLFPDLQSYSKEKRKPRFVEFSIGNDQSVVEISEDKPTGGRKSRRNNESNEDNNDHNEKFSSRATMFDIYQPPEERALPFHKNQELTRFPDLPDIKGDTFIEEDEEDLAHEEELQKFDRAYRKPPRAMDGSYTREMTLGYEMEWKSKLDETDLIMPTKKDDQIVIDYEREPKKKNSAKHSDRLEYVGITHLNRKIPKGIRKWRFLGKPKKHKLIPRPHKPDLAEFFGAPEASSRPRKMKEPSFDEDRQQWLKWAVKNPRAATETASRKDEGFRRQLLEAHEKRKAKREFFKQKEFKENPGKDFKNKKGLMQKYLTKKKVNRKIPGEII